MDPPIKTLLNSVINGEQLHMVPFIYKTLRYTMTGFVANIICNKHFKVVN